jgi:hypothetical protein
MINSTHHYTHDWSMSVVAIFHKLTTNALKPLATTTRVRQSNQKNPATCDPEMCLLSEE